MKLIVGLGNLEQKYDNTRHNIGFMVVDKLADELNIEFKKSKHHALIAEHKDSSEKIFLMKPSTLMNRSGNAVRSFWDFYKMESVKDILVVCDDLNLDVGKLRIRAQGSHGGHNGLRDIISKIGANKFPRLRIGIGILSNSAAWSGYVLSSFKASEKKQINDAIYFASEAVLKWMTGNVEVAQKYLANCN